MKTASRILMTLAAVLAFTGAAQAVPFTVTSSFTNVVGDNGAFKWEVNSKSVPNFNLSVGDSTTIKYGTFKTDDFSIDTADAANQNDRFLANLFITPPTPGTTVSDTGYPDAIQATYFWFWQLTPDTVNVDFDNNPIIKTFGNGGRYEVTFNDLDGITCDGTYDLTATIKLDSDSTPVPEPGTMVLLGAGMLGLAIFGKRRMNRE